MVREFYGINEAWAFTVGEILSRGHFRPGKTGSADDESRELFGHAFTISRASRCVMSIPHRKFDPAYAFAELLWYMNGDRSTEFIKRFAPRYASFEDELGYAVGHYGYRWRHNPSYEKLNPIYDQLDAAIVLLKRDGWTRQAVVTMFDADDVVGEAKAAVDDGRRSKDVPCTLSLQFIVDYGSRELQCMTSMRSNDAWLGTPYDVFCFSVLQSSVAASLGLVAGRYSHHVGSMHVYGRNYDAVRDCCSSRERFTPTHTLDVAVPKVSALRQIARDVVSVGRSNPPASLSRQIAESATGAADDLFTLTACALCCFSASNSIKELEKIGQTKLAAMVRHKLSPRQSPLGEA